MYLITLLFITFVQYFFLTIFDELTQHTGCGRTVKNKIHDFYLILYKNFIYISEMEIGSHPDCIVSRHTERGKEKAL